MKDQIPPNENQNPGDTMVVPTSSYWTMECDLNGKPANYQFSPFVEIISGFKAEYFKGDYKKWLGVVHPEDRQMVFDYLTYLMNHEGDKVIEYRVMRPDGLIRWVSDCATSKFLDNQEMRIDGAVSDITEQKQAEDMLKKSNQQLALWINELQVRKEKIDLLDSISQALQPCKQLEEVYEVLVKYAQKIFPNQQGALYLYDVQANTLNQTISWGHFEGESTWQANMCHAWQDSKPHVSPGSDNRLLCKHDQEHIHGDKMYLCAPLIAQGERVGVFYLRRYIHDFSEGEQYDSIEFWKSMAMMIAERLGFIILNLKLRNDLANQSVRDSLTDLYTPRYLEETLNREIPRAIRYKKNFGILAITIDQFSSFQETMGQAAGNAVLQAYGKFINSQIRRSDIGCRLKENEFIVLLSDASVEDTSKRAELFRMAGKNLKIMFGGQYIRSFTLSIGVIGFPEHGETVNDLLLEAEKALSEAKQSGGDLVTIRRVFRIQ